MDEFVDSVDDATSRASSEGEQDPALMERRIFRDMCVTVAVAVVVCAVFAPWRVTTGVLTGGVLSLFNHYWLRTSVAALFSSTLEGARPKFKVARYVLRYVVIAGLVSVLYKFDLVSLAATLFGMCSFVVAALVEGFRQLYFAIVQREEI